MRGCIVKRGKKYSIVLELERDPMDKEKRNQKWISGYRTRKEAEADLARKISEIERGTYFEASKTSVSEYLEYWLETHKSTIAESTYNRYRNLINYQLVPGLGHIPISKLKPAHVQGLYSSMQKGERKDGQKGSVSPTTIHHAHCVLHKAMDDAVKWQLIPVNPADSVTPPKRLRKECRVAVEKDVEKILETVKDTYLEMPVYLALSTGARLGEILGLQWKDVDLQNGVIYIRQGLMRRKTGEIVFSQTKTPKSRRAVEIGPETIAKLKHHQTRLKEWKLKAGPAWQKLDLVCCLQDGSLINPHSTSSRFHKITSKLGLKLGFHDLRHTHATILLKAGTNPKIVSERLGHSTVGMTLDRYSHVLPTMQREAAAVVEGFLKAR